MASVGPLAYSAFRRALVGRTISSAGTWMQTVAAGWLVFDLTHSATALAVLSGVVRGPAIVLSSYGGMLADRFDRRRLTIVLYALQAIPAGLLAFIAWAETPSIYELYALSLMVGVAGALASPAMQEIVTATVPDRLAKDATAMGSASFNVARLVGPAAGGGLLTAAGPGPCFALNAASYGAVMLLAVVLPDEAGRSPGKAASIRSAARRARALPMLRRLFPLLLLFSLFVAPVQELAPAISRRHGEGAHLLGFLLSGLAVGGLIAIPVRSYLDKHGIRTARTLAGSIAVSAVSLVLLALSPNFAVALVAMVLCGIGWDVLFIVGLNGVQLADERMSGVMTGLFFTATVGGVTLGAWLVGGLFDVAGVNWSLGICAAAVSLGGAWALSIRPAKGAATRA
jgi:predicted MFS family arabinose efflux permease